MALQREAVIRPLAEQPPLAEPDVAEAASRLRLAQVTIYRLVRRYRQTAPNVVANALKARTHSERAIP